MTATNAGASITGGSSPSTLSKNSSPNPTSANAGEKQNFSSLTNEELGALAGELEHEKSGFLRRLDSVNSSLRNILAEQWKRNFGVTIGCLVQLRNQKFKVESFDYRSFF